jgi:hypothetical protein
MRDAKYWIIPSIGLRNAIYRCQQVCRKLLQDAEWWEEIFWPNLEQTP